MTARVLGLRWYGASLRLHRLHTWYVVTVTGAQLGGLAKFHCSAHQAGTCCLGQQTIHLGVPTREWRSANPTLGLLVISKVEV